MKKSLCLVLCLLLFLSGCTQYSQATEGSEPPAASISLRDPSAVAARFGEETLTNEALQVWYWGEVAQYRQSQAQPAPDFSQPLDGQECPLSDPPSSWQQYFLNSALDRWHTAQALLRHSREVPLPIEEAHKIDDTLLHKYMDGMPASQVLYGFDLSYRVNSLHQAYLDNLEQTMEDLAVSSGYAGLQAMAQEAFGSTEEALLDYARTLNQAYMYFTTLSYNLEEEAVNADGAVSDPRVDIRHILLLPGEGEPFQQCLERANALLQEWIDQRSPTVHSFAQLASQYSQDPGSAPNGGLYRHLRREQLPEELALWCFADSRQEGDTAILPTDYGVHILLFLNREDSSVLEQRRISRSRSQKELLSQIRDQHPMSMEADALVLAEADGSVSASDLLYPDIAHERFPVMPLYLQQSYPGTMYGDYKITTNGCGITTLAMVASYLTDEELTPPEMCARYGRYSRPTGTAGSLFEEAPPQLGFYLLKKSYDWREAREYMKQGHQVVVVQHKGYWTGGGHYLALEDLSEGGLVRVRDSNLYNYAKLVRHRDDLFPWETLQSGGKGYWIFEKKVTATAACTRCGDPDSLPLPLVTDYLCEKCETAQLRRDTFLQ